MNRAGLRASRTLAAFLCLASALACAGHLAGWGDPANGVGSALTLRGSAGIVVGLGAAWPWLLLWTPVEPSPVKLPLFAALLSPPLAGLLLFAADAAVGPARGPAVVFGACALTAWLGARRPLAWHPPGKAALAAVGIGALLAGLVAYQLLALGNAPRVMHDGHAWTLAVAARLAEGGGVEDPFLAGLPLQGHPGHAALVGSIARLLALEPAASSALWVVHAVLCAPLALYLWTAVVGRCGPLDVAVVLLALVGWNAQGAAGLGTGSGWANRLAAGVPGSAPGAVWYGLALWLRGGAAAVAAVSLLGAWTAAAHALRHGRRPWFGLCVLLHAWTLVLCVPLGVAGLVASVAAALLSGSEGRRIAARLVPALAAGALPGLYLAVRFGLDAAPERLLRPASGVLAANLRAAAPLLVLLMLGLLVRAVSGRRSPGAGTAEDLGPDRAPFDAGRRTVAVLAGSALVALVLVALSPLGALEGAACLRLAAAPLSLLVGLALAAPARRGRAGRAWVGVGLAVVLGAGSWTTARALGVHAREVGRGNVRLLDWGPRLRMSGGADPLERARAEALDGLDAWGRSGRPGARHPSAVPVLVTRTNLPRERFGPGAGHSLLGALCGACLYLDLAPGAEGGAEDVGDLRGVRRSTLVDLLAGRPTDPVRLGRALRFPGRDTVLLVDERDRSAWEPQGQRGVPRGIDPLLLGMGARLLVDTGDAAVYLLSPEPER